MIVNMSHSALLGLRSLCWKMPLLTNSTVFPRLYPVLNPRVCQSRPVFRIMFAPKRKVSLGNNPPAPSYPDHCGLKAMHPANLGASTWLSFQDKHLTSFVLPLPCSCFPFSTFLHFMLNRSPDTLRSQMLCLSSRFAA